MAGVFFCFKLWIPTAFKKDPLPNVEQRMQVFFWIKRKVYGKIPDNLKQHLKIRWNPEKKEPMTGDYLVKHGAVRDKDGKVVKSTRYRGSGLVYKRHPMMRGAR